VLASRIVQQPAAEPTFVSDLPDTFTQFQMAEDFYTVGLLGHNFLAGASVLNLQINQWVILIYGNGQLKYYAVHNFQSYQALSPGDPFSSFVNFENNKFLTSEEVFNNIYTKESQLVFQTCISKNGQSSWGRLFVIANEIPSQLPARNNFYSFLNSLFSPISGYEPN
jgi:hypothetical protein